MQISGYRCMWVMVMFDLPTDTKLARKKYSQFRKFLLEDGFTQMQYSVYIRHAPSEENATVHVQRVERKIPSDGEVRILTFTDKQFERMRVFFGKKRVKTESPGAQLELF
ncbi:MAG: CRISPR-associated endonuclease Cas2 [Planctomycetaceae bacterium]